MNGASNGVLVRRHPVAAGLIAEITLDRPEAMNALSTTVLTALTERFLAVRADPAVLAVVLSGSGERAFCAGADLKERAAMSDAQIMAQRPVFRAAFSALLALPQPVLAAVHGFALGGGCELALSCDVIVADDSAVFGLPEMPLHGREPLLNSFDVIFVCNAVYHS